MRNLISYLIFGVLTTLINLAVYGFCYHIVGQSNVLSTIIAWVIAVVFAFVTNKLLVFESKSLKFKKVVREAGMFFSCRLLTGLLDLLIMYLAVDVAKGNGMLWKIISNVLVIIVNYIASKVVIFKERR